MKLLLVEDNDRLRELIKNLVQDLAAAIYECRDGSEALAAYAQHRPDWVLMDIKMEQVDGLTATRQIKAVDPQAKIMIVTDYNDDEMREAARGAGAIEYVAKENLIELRRILLRSDDSPLHPPSNDG